MNKRYYQWRLNFVSRKHTEFNEWLLAKDADIFSGHGLNQGEVFKFKMKGGVGILYKTGRCNPFFNKMAKLFQDQYMEQKQCVA